MNVAYVLIAIMLSACQKQTASTGNEAQSLDFYRKHVEKARTVAEKCVAFENGELSKLPGDKQREWHDSIDGVNCQNAKTAWSYEILAERQRKLQESDDALK